MTISSFEKSKCFSWYYFQALTSPFHSLSIPFSLSLSIQLFLCFIFCSSSPPSPFSSFLHENSVRLQGAVTGCGYRSCGSSVLIWCLGPQLASMGSLPPIFISQAYSHLNSNPGAANNRQYLTPRLPACRTCITPKVNSVFGCTETAQH